VLAIGKDSKGAGEERDDARLADLPLVAAKGKRQRYSAPHRKLKGKSRGEQEIFLVGRKRMLPLVSLRRRNQFQKGGRRGRRSFTLRVLRAGREKERELRGFDVIQGAGKREEGEIAKAQLHK